MARFTSLDGGRLAAIAERYGLGGAARAEPLAAGTINSNFRLECDRGPIFLRVNEGKSEDEAAYEAALVAFLADGGVPTPRPIPTVDGAPYASVDGVLVTLFPWLAGEHREPPAPADCAAVGRSLATLHRVGARFPDRRPGRYAKPRIEERARALAGVAPPEVVADIDATLEALAGWQPATDGIIHGDLFPDNVLFAGDRAVLLDFEQASGGSFVYDLAVCLLSWCWADGFVADKAGALVRAYGPVDGDELYTAARFAAVRFTVTRLGDVELDPRVAPEIRAVKDYREFWARMKVLNSRRWSIS